MPGAKPGSVNIINIHIYVHMDNEYMYIPMKKGIYIHMNILCVNCYYYYYYYMRIIRV